MNVLIEFKREVILIRISRCLCLNHSRFKKEENTLLNLYGVLMKINYDLKKYIFLLFPISSSSVSHFFFFCFPFLLLLLLLSGPLVMRVYIANIGNHFPSFRVHVDNAMCSVVIDMTQQFVISTTNIRLYLVLSPNSIILLGSSNTKLSFNGPRQIQAHITWLAYTITLVFYFYFF